jgi:hypothetical protein
MNKIMIVAGCLLGLALACIPAYASPTDKKITLSCNITAGTDIITGTAMVTVCDSALCDGQTVLCDPVDCDSSGVTAPISITVACDSLIFKVAGFHEVIRATDYAGNVIDTGGSDVINALGGKGYKVQINTDPGFVTDSVALTIK